MLELPALRLSLKRGWFFSVFLGLLIHLCLPAVLIGVAYIAGWGEGASFSKGGITLRIAGSVDLFTPAFLKLCVILAISMTLFKAVFLIGFSPGRRPHFFALLFLSIVVPVSTSIFVTGMVADKTKLLAQVTSKILGKKRMPAGLDKIDTNDPLKSAQPLMDYYKGINKQLEEKLE